MDSEIGVLMATALFWQSHLNSQLLSVGRRVAEFSVRLANLPASAAFLPALATLKMPHLLIRTSGDNLRPSLCAGLISVAFERIEFFALPKGQQLLSLEANLQKFNRLALTKVKTDADLVLPMLPLCVGVAMQAVVNRGDYASHYLLPCIDAAVLMRAKNGKLMEQVGELARYSPDESCPWCLGRINQKALAYELLTEQEREQRARAAEDAIRRGIDGAQYWGDKPPRELTVGYMTTMVGAMQAGYAEGWITGASSMPHQRFQFDLGMPLLGVVPCEKPRRPECSCNWTKGWGDQARAERSITMPSYLEKAEVLAAIGSPNQ